MSDNEPANQLPADQGNQAVSVGAPEEEKSPIYDNEFKLGQVVRYVRVLPDNTIEKSTGKVVGLNYDHTLRPVYRLKNNDKIFNVDAIAVNADEAQEAKYLAHQQDIRGYTEQANKAIAQLTNEANTEIERRNTEVLGAPITL